MDKLIRGAKRYRDDINTMNVKVNGISITFKDKYEYPTDLKESPFGINRLLFAQPHHYTSQLPLPIRRYSFAHIKLCLTNRAKTALLLHKMYTQC